VFDSHVHAAPDVLDRSGDDSQVARAYELADFSGFVLKAHYESTVGRAHGVAELTRRTVYGGIALNQHTGGVNPSAVAAALAAGGRVVWMPTADAHTQQAAGLPRLCDQELVLALIADHDAVLATGHLSGSECRWLSERATAFGITRLLFTHPSYTVPGLNPATVRALVEAGGYAEITAYQLLHQPDCTPALLARVAEAAGEHLILSSDAGQPDSPSPPEALVMLVDVLTAEGLDRGWLTAAASSTPTALFAPG
jgi:hypothetical protein